MRLDLLFLTAVGAFACGSGALRIERRDDSSDTIVDDQQQNGQDDNAASSVANVAATVDNPICNECTKDPGICCAVACQGDGHCPQLAVENAGWTIGGVKITGPKRRFFL